MFRRFWNKTKRIATTPLTVNRQVIHDEVFIEHDIRWTAEQRQMVINWLTNFNTDFGRLLTLEDLRGLADNFVEQEPNILMSTIKVLKNSLSISGEDDRLDIEVITCQDKEPYFLFILNDQSIEVTMSQASRVSDFLKYKH